MGPIMKITQNVLNQIQEMRNENIPIREISNKLNLGRRTISRYYDRMEMEKIERKCEFCGKPFVVERHYINKIFCSKEHEKKFRIYNKKSIRNPAIGAFKAFFRRIDKKETKEKLRKEPKIINREQLKLKWKENYIKHSTKQIERQRNKRQENRLELLNIIGNSKIECEHCGMNIFELLDVNHKEGGGNKEVKQCRTRNGKVKKDYMLVLLMNFRKGKENKDRFNILCKSCNYAYRLLLEGNPTPWNLLENLFR